MSAYPAVASQNRLQPTRTPIQNQNQTQTQNQNQAIEPLLIQTREMEQVGTGSGQGQALQVRQMEQEQDQIKAQTEEKLKQADQRSKIARFFLGPDTQAVKNMQTQLEQNQNRIQELTQLRSQISNQAEKQALTNAIQVITEQNTALQEKIAQQNKTFSLFGWLFRLFAK